MASSIGVRVILLRHPAGVYFLRNGRYGKNGRYGTDPMIPMLPISPIPISKGRKRRAKPVPCSLTSLARLPLIEERRQGGSLQKLQPSPSYRINSTS